MVTKHLSSTKVIIVVWIIWVIMVQNECFSHHVLEKLAEEGQRLRINRIHLCL